MRFTKSSAIVIAGLAGLAACSSSELAPDPNSLTISVSTEVSDGACRPVAEFSIGKDHELRLVNYRITMTGPGEADRTRIPTGEVLHQSSNVKRGRSISLHNHVAACAEMTVVWDEFECENEERQKMECPPIVLAGGSGLKGAEIVAPTPE